MALSDIRDTLLELRLELQENDAMSDLTDRLDAAVEAAEDLDAAALAESLPRFREALISAVEVLTSTRELVEDLESRFVDDVLGEARRRLAKRRRLFPGR